MNGVNNCVHHNKACLELIHILLFILVQLFQNKYKKDNQQRDENQLNFRINQSYNTFHDIRNQLYSSILLMKDSILIHNEQLDSNITKDAQAVLESNIYVLENVVHLQNVELIFKNLQMVKLNQQETKYLQSCINNKISLFLLNKNQQVRTILTKGTISQIQIDKKVIIVLILNIISIISDQESELIEITWSSKQITQNNNNTSGQYNQVQLNEDYQTELNIKIKIKYDIKKIINQLIYENPLMSKIENILNITNNVSLKVQELKDGLMINVQIFKNISINEQVDEEDINNLDNNSKIIQEYSIFKNLSKNNSSNEINQENSKKFVKIKKLESIMDVELPEDQVRRLSQKGIPFLKPKVAYRRRSEFNNQLDKVSQQDNLEIPYKDRRIRNCRPRGKDFYSTKSPDDLSSINKSSRSQSIITEDDNYHNYETVSDIRNDHNINFNDILKIVVEEKEYEDYTLTEHKTRLSKNQNHKLQYKQLQYNELSNHKSNKKRRNTICSLIVDNLGDRTNRVLRKSQTLNIYQDFSFNKVCDNSKLTKDFNFSIQNESIYRSSNNSQTNIPIAEDIDYLKSQFINVDDEGCILNINKKLFKKRNMDLHICKSGTELIQLLESLDKIDFFKNKVLVIIMDYKLVGEFGDEVILKTKKWFHFMDPEEYVSDSDHCLTGKNVHRKQSLKFVALTSTEDRVVYEKFLSVGVEKILNKPLSKQSVEQIIKLI